MAETQYVALLRGINVGGNNLIKMGDLKACFEKLGLAEVATYIQSGRGFSILWGELFMFVTIRRSWIIGLRPKGVNA